MDFVAVCGSTSIVLQRSNFLKLKSLYLQRNLYIAKKADGGMALAIWGVQASEDKRPEESSHGKP